MLNVYCLKKKFLSIKFWTTEVNDWDFVTHHTDQEKPDGSIKFIRW